MADDPNVALIKDMTLKWVTKQFEEILPKVADDAEYIIGRGSLAKVSPLFGHFKGKAQIKKWYQSNMQVKQQRGVQPFCSVKVLGEFISAGDQVINFGSLPPGGGAPASDWVAIWTVKGGMIEKCSLVMDT